MRVVLLLVLSTLVASAQEMAYAPPSKELWQQMVQALQQVPMSLPSHQQVNQILQNVQQSAQQAAMAEAARKEKPK